MTFLSTLEERAKEYEAAIEKSLANHNGMLGALAELKNMMAIATPVVDAIMPSAAPAMATAETVISEAETALEAVGNSSESSVSE